MRRENQSERELAEKLCAYIEQKSERGDNSEADLTGAGSHEDCTAAGAETISQLRSAAAIVDLLRDEGSGNMVDPAFIDALSARLQTHAQMRGVNPGTAPSFWKKCRYLIARFTMVPHRRNLVMRLTWAMTIIVAVLATLSAVLVTRPTALPPDQILARASAATQLESEKVEHTVVETRFEKLAAGDREAVSSYIAEDWRHIEATLDDRLITVERTSARYTVTDTERKHPISWAYETWSKRCFLDLADYPTIYRDAGTDEIGCLLIEEIVRLSIPGTLDEITEAGPRAWIGRLQVKPETLQYRTTTFEGENVYRVTEAHEGITLTLYLSRRDYLPVAFIAEAQGYRLTQIVEAYEVITREALSTDPFVWPPHTVQTEPADIVTRVARP
jgi:hypothetical protein